MSNRLTRAEAKQRTRQAVLDAAAVVFVRAGYDGATVQEIAEEAGRTTGAIYTHFATKADLFRALLDQEQQARRETFEGFARSGGDIVERFAAWLERDADRSDLLNFEFWPSASRDPQLASERSRRLRAEHAGMARVFEMIYEQEGRKPPLPPLELARLVVALADGLRMLRRTDPDAPIRDLYAYALRSITRPADPT